ncbi:hypothetical protein HUU62_27965, partial [Rhodoferax sp. 4810]|nr:hypothetical protein [Rhodoferax jenense]
MSELKMHPVYVGRQPIFDRNEKIIGFELLFRSGHTTVAEFYDEHAATHDLLRAAFVDIGIEQLVGQHQAFLNLTRAFFHNCRVPCDYIPRRNYSLLL